MILPVVRGIYSTLKSMMDILSFAEREAYHGGADSVSQERSLLFCICDRCDEGRNAVTVPGSARARLRADLAQSHIRYFLLVPEREVIAVDITVEEAMKLIVSGGLYTPNPSSGTSSPAGGKTVDIDKQPDAGVQVG